MAFSTWVAFGTLISVLPVLGVLAGLARARLAGVPIMAGAVVVVAYGIYMAAVGIWAAQCWDCPVGTQNDRGEVLTDAAVFFGLIAATTLLGIWLGARLAIVLQRLLRTWRELRGVAGQRDASEAGKGNA